MTSRAELEQLGREALIGLAASMGVANARALPRVDLVDEILQRDGGQTRASRGFFGLARDLLARVVERGLHLPEERAIEPVVVSEGASVLPNEAASSPPGESESAPHEGSLQVASEASKGVATVTLASIYAAQGLVSRALGVLERVLQQKPDDAAALSLQAHLHGAPLLAPSTLSVHRTSNGVRVVWNAGHAPDTLAVLRCVQITPRGLTPLRELSERIVSGRGTMELEMPARVVFHAAIGVRESNAFVSRAHA